MKTTRVDMTDRLVPEHALTIVLWDDYKVRVELHRRGEFLVDWLIDLRPGSQRGWTDEDWREYVQDWCLDILTAFYRGQDVTLTMERYPEVEAHLLKTIYEMAGLVL